MSVFLQSIYKLQIEGKLFGKLLWKGEWKKIHIHNMLILKIRSVMSSWKDNYSLSSVIFLLNFF